MKTLQSLHRKIKNPHFIGFTSASLIYLGVGFAFLDRSSAETITLKQNGNHNISLRISSIDNGGEQTQWIKKEYIQSKPKTQKPKKRHKKQKHEKREKPLLKQQKIQEKQEITQQDIPQSNLNQKGENQTQTLAYNEGVSDEFLSKIRTAIFSHNQYPRLARTRRTEGEVIVEFILSQNGIMEELKIIESRAEEILQKSAIKAVEKAMKYFPTPPQRVRIRVPIVYSLRA